jgi:hypothetical protein
LGDPLDILNFKILILALAHKIIPAAARWDIDDRRMFDMPDFIDHVLGRDKGA